MPELSHSERLDRLEQVVHILAEDQVSLQKIVSSLATETRQAFDRVAEHMRETDKRMRQTDERFRATDERIDKLVQAIGELIRLKN